MDRVMKILALVIIISLAFPAAAYSVNEGEDGSEAGSQQGCSTTCEISPSELEEIRSTPSMRTPQPGGISLTPEPTPEPEPEPEPEEEIEPGPEPEPEPPEEDISPMAASVNVTETGWHFIGASQETTHYLSEVCDYSVYQDGDCNEAYYYDSGTWEYWEEGGEEMAVRETEGFWLHINETGRLPTLEGDDFSALDHPHWGVLDSGWNPIGWNRSTRDMSDSISYINDNSDANIVRVWKMISDTTGEIHEYWNSPGDSGDFSFPAQFFTHGMTEGYWVCSDEGGLATGYCEGSKPPRMPWQTDYFNVSTVSAGNIDEGEDLEVNATLENTAGEEATQNVTLVVPELDLRKVKENVTVGAKDTKEVTITTSIEGDLGDYTAVIYTGNKETKHRGEDTFTIHGSNFDVQITDTNSPVEEGEPLNVSATVTNTGDQSGTQDIDLTIDGSLVDTTTETINPGAEKDVTLSWGTGEGDAGDYTAEVSTEDDSDTAGVTVLGDPYFDVDLTGTNSPIQEGDTLTVDATITNTGESDTQDIELEVGGVTRDTTTETIDGNSEKAVTLSWNTQEGDAGDYTAEVLSEDDSDSTSITVSELEDPHFNVNITSTNSPVQEGDTLTVDTTITNTGDQSDTQEIDLNINGTTKDSKSLSLGASDSQAITLEWNTSTGDAGTYTAEVSSEDDSDSTAVEVEEEPVEEYSLTATVDGEGSVEIDPEQATYEHGTEVTLTADPEDGWEFVEWTGDYESSQEEITVTMDEDKEITARFEEEGEGGEEAVPAADIALLLLGLSLAVMIYHVKKR